MKTYYSHKVVQAFKIKELKVDFLKNTRTLIGETDSVEITQEWCERHLPFPKGYYVKYPDGYTSYSPAKAFEEGYIEIK